MQGLVQVTGGSVMRPRLPAVMVSDKAVGSIPIQIQGLAIDDVGYAPSLCDGSAGCAKKGGIIERAGSADYVAVAPRRECSTHL